MTDGKGILARPEATGEEIRQAWNEAVAIALRSTTKAGVPVVDLGLGDTIASS